MSDEKRSADAADDRAAEKADKVSAEEQAARERGAAFQAKVADPVPEEGTTNTEENKPKRLPRGKVLVQYTGPADVVQHGEFQFRPGQPVEVPSEVAEDLLTLPFETFELIEGNKE